MTKHHKLLNKWNSCEFGVKTRVFNEISQQHIDYILKHPEYKSKEKGVDKIQEIMDCIDEKTKELLEEVKEMYNKIQGV